MIALNNISHLKQSQNIETVFKAGVAGMRYPKIVWVGLVKPRFDKICFETTNISWKTMTIMS